jgi:hypothetical protein
MTGTTVTRFVIGAIGLALLAGGILIGVGIGGGAIVPAFWMIVSGTIVVIVALIETMRYRSEAAEMTRGAPGPGGGESAPPEGRFRPTDEVFVDPTTQRRMRVYADNRTGERRYVADG